MKTFAVIKNGIVVNSIVANSLEDAELATELTCVEYIDGINAGIDWLYDGKQFISPILEDPTTVVR